MDLPKLSRTERFILERISGEEMFGLQIVEQSNGALKRGTCSDPRRMRTKATSSRGPKRSPPAIGRAAGLYRPTAYGLRVLAVGSMRSRA